MKEKGYNVVVELEDLHTLLGKYDNELLIAILLFITEKLNNDKNVSNLYDFDVIAYGYGAPYYPAIGVVYLKYHFDVIYSEKDIKKYDEIEELVKKEFESIINSHTMKEFVVFSVKNSEQIKAIIEKIKD